MPTINYHLDQIDKSGESHLSDTIRKIRMPSDKWHGELLMYNLDVVIAVGYRVNSYEATFEHIIEKYVEMTINTRNCAPALPLHSAGAQSAYVT